MFSRRFIIAQIFFICAFLLLFALKQSKSFFLPVYGKVADFSLLDQNKKEVTLGDLKGKVWVADFIFTTCSGICPTMSKNMSALHHDFARRSNVRLVSISVNPENDSSEALNLYAKKYKAQGSQWIFLTGRREDIQKLAVESFKMGDMKDIVFHSALFTLVDRKAQIRGYYDGTDEAALKQLHKDLSKLSFPVLPTINASLNGLAGVFLLFGFIAIKRRNKNAHHKWMMAAFSCSALFLCTYVYYHATTHLLTRYQGQGIWKGIYFFILGTHTPLAILIVPFILMAIRHAIKGNFEKHTRITRWIPHGRMFL
jgi:cytochrome oxidase Cu insertion factor (SCO1/SenC/PrrC family)